MTYTKSSIITTKELENYDWRNTEYKDYVAKYLDGDYSDEVLRKVAEYILAVVESQIWHVYNRIKQDSGEREALDYIKRMLPVAKRLRIYFREQQLVPRKWRIERMVKIALENGIVIPL